MTNDTRKFYIDWEAADLITVTNLRDAYAYLKTENAEIEALDEIPEHKSADLVYNTNMLKALKRVLHYYGVEAE